MVNGTYVFTVVPFKNGFSAVIWCCLHAMLKRSKVLLTKMFTLTVRVNEALILQTRLQGPVHTEKLGNIYDSKLKQGFC